MPVEGELESVEDFAAAFVVHVVLGHGGDDFADGELDGGAIFEDGDVEFMGHEGGVVVDGAMALLVGAEVEIAIRLAFEGGGSAPGAGGLDVATFLVHGVVLPFRGRFWALERGGSRRLRLGFDLSFYFIKLRGFASQVSKCSILLGRLELDGLFTFLLLDRNPMRSPFARPEPILIVIN